MNELFQDPAEYTESDEYPPYEKDLFVCGDGSWESESEYLEPGSEDFGSSRRGEAVSETGLSWDTVKALLLKMGYLVTAGATVLSLSVTAVPEKAAEDASLPVYSETTPEPSPLPEVVAIP